MLFYKIIFKFEYKIIKKGTFDGEIIIEHFINDIFKKQLSDNNIRKSLVILDRATCHTTLMFKEAFNKLGTKIFFIPANCTGTHFFLFRTHLFSL